MANSLRYPKSIIGYDTDHTRIQVIKYTPPGINNGTGNGFNFATTSSRNQANARNILSTIYLPIPTNLADTNVVNWDDSSINSLALKAISSLEGVIDSAKLEALQNDFLGTASNIAGSASQALQEFASGLDDNVREQLKTALIGEGVNVFGANIDPQQLISRDTGQVLNPNLELVFRGVKLRNFSFTFDLTPRSQDEGNSVRQIINTFKKHMAAKSSVGSSGSSGIFIGAPDIFQVAFRRGASPHPFLFTMKQCALVGMDVNYNGAGNYVTYPDGTPVKMAMQLRFKEVNPIYSEDYDNVDGVGY